MRSGLHSDIRRALFLAAVSLICLSGTLHVAASERLKDFAEVAEDARKNIRVVSGDDAGKEDRLSSFSSLIEDAEKLQLKENEEEPEYEGRLSSFSSLVKETESKALNGGSTIEDRRETVIKDRVETVSTDKLRPEAKGSVKDRVFERGRDYSAADLGIRVIWERPEKKAGIVEIKEPFKKSIFKEGINLDGFFRMTDSIFNDNSDDISLGMFTLTAYDACVLCCGKTDGITSTGTRAEAGRTIAVDPSVIPYGTKVRIGSNTYIAEDTGSKIKGKHIDIFMETHEIAKQFGRKQGEVFLVK